MNRQLRWFRLVLLVPAFVYLGVVQYWGPTVPITGDEPHYLIIADSLVRDGDLQVVNNYQLEAQQRAFIGPTEPHSQNFQYSVHNPGFAVLIAGPYAWWGAAGAKRALAFGMGVFAVLFFLVARRNLSEGAALTVALACALAMPLLDGAGQLFPDLTSGLLIFALLVSLGLELDGAQGRFSRWAFNVGVACLPWLHLKQAAPWLVLGAVWGWRVWLAHPAMTARLKALAPVLVPLASMLALFAYNAHAFGSWQGPYAPGSQTLEWRKVLMIFSALLFDQTQGVLLQQPLYFLGLVGLPLLWRAHGKFTLVLLALMLSLLLPNAMHTNWFGGLTLVGRFFWSSAALWAFPTVAFLAWVEPRARGVVPMIAAMSVLNQGWLATHWLDAPRKLYAWGFAPVERRGVIVDSLRHRLPTFADFDAYLSSGSFWIPTLFAAALVVTGWRLARAAPAANATAP